MPNAYNFGTFQLIEGDVNYGKIISNPNFPPQLYEIDGAGGYGNRVEQWNIDRSSCCAPSAFTGFWRSGIKE